MIDFFNLIFVRGEAGSFIVVAPASAIIVTRPVGEALWRRLISIINTSWGRWLIFQQFSVILGSIVFGPYR